MRVALGLLLAVVGLAAAVFSTRITRAGAKRSERRRNESMSRSEKGIVLVCFVGGGVLLRAAGTAIALEIL
ncbi:hypothetical protein [Streptomyces tauricus]|uniref:hypothetical protein n=1 Tax=Streptomyces tauricus TaxID=68274 RepID=UPI003801F3EA